MSNGGIYVDTSMIAFLMIIILSNTQKKESFSLSFENNFLSNMVIDQQYTTEKIRIVKKIGPYLPEQYIPLINKSVLFTEKIIKITELVEFMQESDYQTIEETIEINNNKERLNKIISVIQKEANNSEMKNLGTVLDLIVNMDKYKSMINILSSVMSSGDALKDPSKLISLIAPIMDTTSNKDNEKIKEMNKMMEIFKLLNTPGPTKGEDKDNHKERKTKE